MQFLADVGIPPRTVEFLTQLGHDAGRLSDERPASVNQRLSVVLDEQGAVLDAGALILVEDSRKLLTDSTVATTSASVAPNTKAVAESGPATASTNRGLLPHRAVHNRSCRVWHCCRCD